MKGSFKLFFIQLRSFLAFSLLVLIFVSCGKEVFVEPKGDQASIPYSSLAIESTPPGALIFLNGRNTGYTTPDTIKYLVPGPYQVVLKMENFRDTSFSLSFQQNAETKANINYLLNPKMLGSINCTSTPPGAKIYLDNVNTGKITPALFTRLAPKQYKVRYDLPTYRQDSSLTTVKSSQINLVNSALDDTLDIIQYSMPGPFVTSVGEDKYGNIWAGTSEGLAKFTGNKYEMFTTLNSSFMTSNMVTQIRKDNDNNLWVGTSNSILKYNGTSWAYYYSKMVNCLFVGFDNTVLSATEGGGITKISSSGVVKYNTGNSRILHDGASAVSYDLNKRIWAGPYYNGVNIFDGTNWTYLNTGNNGVPFDNNCELVLNNNGTMYGVFFKDYPTADAPVETYIVRFNSNNTFTRIYYGFDNIYDREPYFDSKNRLWIGFSGIMRITDDSKIETITQIINQKLRLFSYPMKWNYLFAKRTFIDSKGNLWLYGGYYGLLKVKQGRWVN